MAEIKLTSVKKSYNNKVQVIHGVTMSVADGEFIVIVGPSGCGKSTLLRMVAGLEEISGGEIAIGNRVVNDLEPADRDIAMVFQNYALYPHMTVYDNMAYGLKIKKTPMAEIKQRVDKAAGILELGHLLDRKPRQLSGGQRQRVAMGRAIVRQPQVFLFDEPLSNLDAKLRVQMRVELKRLHERLETTAIYVTHDQVEAMTLGDRVVVMRDGTVQQEGAPLELYQRPANRFVAGFIGSPAMNFAAVTVTERDGGLRLVNEGLDIAAPPHAADRLRACLGREVTLGIRPEDLRIATAADPADFAFDALVEVVEKLGSEILLDLKVGRGAMVAAVEPTVRAVYGDRLRIALNPDRLHFFDAQTDATI
ncbi:MAG: sn-glycerol-3-phosphate import ATP-binding protein UgpC [Microvirga sp.]